MEIKYLLLWFEAPLQSWGANSHFDRRETLTFPTKSGVTGLILCAMGASGKQIDFLSRLAPYKQTAYSFINKKINKPPLLSDFHMVGSGYDDTDPWLSMMIPKKTDGGKAVGGGTKLTYRSYLQDAKLGIIMEIPSDISKDISYAFENPIYDLYLGKKCCVPTDIIFRGIHGSGTDAQQHLFNIAESKKLFEEFRVIDVPDKNTSDDTFVLNDVPIQFGERKKYKSRRVKIITAI